MRRKITGYDYELADRLAQSSGPYSHVLARHVLDENVKKVEVARLFADSVVALEGNYKKVFDELVEYKMRFGELS